MLNLIEDAWIPVRCADGSQRIIAPWQMAEPDVVAPDWPRPDMNIACYELLIGLVYMAAPPADDEEWEDRAEADPQQLKAALAPYASAFNLLGSGPLFMQDLEPLAGAPNPVDMLFIDSAGGQTMRNNIDVMVHRNRYRQLSLPEAAMALYMLQDFAPSGGAGNRTSMRGGGPLVTLLDPERTLWDFVWLNTPFGEGPSPKEALPWMKPTRTSEAKQEVSPPNECEEDGFNVEAFFGMPRRLRLVGTEEGVTGVIQRPYGTNYVAWRHPLSPYYRQKQEASLLPRHPRAGHFGYRNWLGVVAKETSEDERKDLARRALVIREFTSNLRGGMYEAGEVSVLVAGWAMSNMSPLDFILSRQPCPLLSDEQQKQLEKLILAAERVASALYEALRSLLEGGEARNAQREEFFVQTEADFHHCYILLAESKDWAEAWLIKLRKQALRQFDALARPGLAERDMKSVKNIVTQRKFLQAALWGHTSKGREIFDSLGMAVPEKRKRKAA